MSGYLIDEKISNRLFIICWVANTAAMIGRNSYSSALVSIVNDGVFTKTDAGLIGSLFFILYGGGQFLSGYLGDRISPFKLILAGLVVAAITNLAMSISHNYTIMLVVWSINGLAQSVIWSPVLYIVSSVLTKTHRQKACLYISTSFCAGALLSYLISVIVLRYCKWNAIFAVSAYIVCLSSILWIMISIAVSKKIVRYKQDENVFINVQENTKKDFNKMLASTGIVFIMVPVMMKCMLDIGVTTWVPTMIAETYTVTPLFSTFLAMFLPMTNLFGTYIAANLNERFIKDEVKTSSLLYSLCLPPLCLLLLIGKINIYVCVAMLAVITTFVTGVTLMLFVLIPTRFAKYGKTSSVAGLLNGVATVGIVISNYGYGYVSQKFGWNATILFWIFIAVVAIVFCMLAFQKWRAFIAEKI